jgi:hypothetical protein
MSAALADRAEELFSDRRWRLNNLYKIKDKAGNAVDFRLNPAQENFSISSGRSTSSSRPARWASRR